MAACAAGPSLRKPNVSACSALVRAGMASAPARRMTRRALRSPQAHNRRSATSRLARRAPGQPSCRMPWPRYSAPHLCESRAGHRGRVCLRSSTSASARCASNSAASRGLCMATARAVALSVADRKPARQRLRTARAALLNATGKCAILSSVSHSLIFHNRIFSWARVRDDASRNRSLAGRAHPAQREESLRPERGRSDLACATPGGRLEYPRAQPDRTCFSRASW